jgi:hypothetical protein
MRTGKRFITQSVLFLTFFHGFGLIAQNLPIGGWKMHLPYQSAKYVTGSSTYVWAATDNGLFRLNKSDLVVERITKIEGLSDLSIGAIGYNSNNGVLLVGYTNGNIDIIRGNTIVNLPDIKRALIVADKTINNFYFVGNLAYVSTGFGIVVIDTDRDEIRDTYLIGTNGTYLEVYDIVSDGTLLFAGTKSGIYFAPINDPTLSNYATWSKYTTISVGSDPYNYANGNFICLDIYNSKLVVQHESIYPNPTGAGKALFYDFATSTWDSIAALGGTHVTDYYVMGGFLFVATTYSIYRLDQTFGNAFLYNALDNQPGHFLLPHRIFIDEWGTVWASDTRYGLVKAVDYTEGYSYFPNGPLSINSFWMDLRNDQLLTVTGGVSDAWNAVINREGHSIYANDVWTGYTKTQYPMLDTVGDFVTCAIDPNDAGHYFLGSYGQGLVEVNNGVATLWNETNSILESSILFHFVAIGGMAYDEDNNLWMTNSRILKCLAVRKADGTWKNFDFTGLIPIDMNVGEMMITSSGQKWMILPRGAGILVFDDNGTIDDISDDRRVRLGFTAGTGGIPSDDVLSMAEDKDGEIWIGTKEGIAVFYCADQIFESGGCDAQQILINQDGHVQILLETQTITAIVVDGANRKWIGTESGGVFLMSEDGTQQLAHFDASNSPLLSDQILSMAINEKTGEIFFGTSKGIVSYRGEATEGTDEMGDVYAFPNPVQHDYTGPIAITGLVKDADVKITDVRGNVVFKTKSLGGQAIWYGNNFKGERAATGVYLVFITNEDGTEKAVTKILLIN